MKKTTEEITVKKAIETLTRSKAFMQISLTESGEVGFIVSANLAEMAMLKLILDLRVLEKSKESQC